MKAIRLTLVLLAIVLDRLPAEELAAKHDVALVHFQPVFEAACKAAPGEH